MISDSGSGYVLAALLQLEFETNDFSTESLITSCMMQPVTRDPFVSDFTDVLPPLRLPLPLPLVDVMVFVRTSFSVGDVTSVLNTPFSSSTTGIVFFSPRNTVRPSVVPLD